MSFDYDFPEKDKWRKWAWKRLRVLARDARWNSKRAIVVFMPGPNNLDLPHAIKNRFRKSNLIGVDRDLSVVKSQRRNGINMIHGDLADILLAWDKPPLPDAILGDFCSGMTTEVERFVKALFILHHKRLAIYGKRGGNGFPCIVNLMRGRDADSNAFRELELDGDRHRGRAFMDWVIRQYAFNGLNEQDLKGYKGDGTFWEAYRKHGNGMGEIPKSKGQVFFWQVPLIDAGPKFHSYRSACGAVYFDSVSYLHKFTFLNLDGEKDGITVYDLAESRSPLSPLRRKVAATKAVRTMRRCQP